MTIRLFFVLLYGIASMIFFLAALVAPDAEKRQTRLLFSIWLTLAEIAQILNAVAIHTGAFPLWNNR